MKELGDELIASGVNIDDEELLLYILDGLGPEYDAVVANLQLNSSHATLQEAQFLLHKHEMHLERQNGAMMNFHEHLSSALMASRQKPPETGSSLNLTSSGMLLYYPSSAVQPIAAYPGVVPQHVMPQQIQTNNSESSVLSQYSVGNQMSRVFTAEQNSFPYNPTSHFVLGSVPFFNKGRGRGRGYFKPRLVCQVCGKTGHSALQCFHCFDHDYQGFTVANSNYEHTGHKPPGSSFPIRPNEPIQALFASNSMLPKSAHNSVARYHDYSAYSYPSLTQQYPGQIFAHGGTPSAS